MSETSRGSLLTRLLAPLVVFALVILAGVLSKDVWWQSAKPHVARVLGFSMEEEHEAEEAHADPDVLHITDQARATLGVRIERIKRLPLYEKTIRVPGRVVEIPGSSLQEVTAGLSGVITNVYVRKGQGVKPGDRLFDVSLIHENAVQTQLELLDALGKQESSRLELELLEGLNQKRKGSIPLSRIREKEYEVRRQNHTIESRKQALLLLGVTDAQIDALVHEHDQHPPQRDRATQDVHDDFEHPLIDAVTIHAPKQKPNSTQLPEGYLVSELPVHPGEHVDAGQLLCQLADYRVLYVEGRSFEHHLSNVRQAIRKKWPVATILNPGESNPTVRENLRILFQDPKVDPQSRTTRFYVELKNAPVRSHRVENRFFVDWESRPGELAEILVPVERMENKLVIPVDAVAQDGLDNFVFVASGSTFIRRTITVEYRDQRSVVIGKGSRVYEGDSIAMSGAYQLQLALKNRASGPVDPHAGHNHAH